MNDLTRDPNDNRVILLDCFGLFIEDPYNRFFREKLGPDYGPTKDRFCHPGDRGEISYEEFLQNIGEYFHMDPALIRKWAKEVAKPKMDMVELAKRCKRARPTYLLSNCMENMIDEYLPREVLSPCFDGLFLSNEMRLVKPTAEAFFYVLDALNLSPDQVYFYDDNARNIEVAKSLGIHATLFTSVEACEKDLKEKGLL